MAISPTQAQVGRLSCSIRFASINGTDTISNAALLAVCERGALYNLLYATYATIGDFLTAWASKGGILDTQSDRPTTCVVSWTLSANKPQLTVVDTGVAAVASRIALSFSATR